MIKCQNCGEKNATFYWKRNINGKITEIHLCEDCAQKLGYAQRMRGGIRSMNLFPAEDLFFSPMESLFNGLSTRLLTEFPSPVEEQAAQRPADLINGAQQEKWRRVRQKNALEAQLKTAIETEDFETAARIRDQLKDLPQ